MASIAEARDLFKRLSGRYDLTTLQIDEYLNRGQEFLDEQSDFQKSPRRYQVQISAGQALVTLPAAIRAITQVWVGTADSRFELQKVDEAWLRAVYAEPVENLDRGQPIRYSPDPLTYENASGVFAWGDVDLSDSFDNNGLLVMPPSDQTYQIEVVGRFYSPTLSDSQSSWWLVNKHFQVVRAALRELEADYRNTAGMKDHEYSMQLPIKSINDDAAEEDSVGISEMDG